MLLITLMVAGGCDYARMSETESVRTYEESMPEMPQGAIPVQGGIQIYREMDPEEITNPLPFEGAIVELGQRGYGYFCVMCHGPRLDGNGTVGQSFYPLPTHLKRAYVQKQPDGVLFYKISFGYKRHPYLADTVSEDYRWAIIHYLRSLVKSKAS
jgi:mono/diheme cytochrome c family protein